MTEILTKNFILKKLSQEIRKSRIHKKLSQEKLAELVDISINHMNNIENMRSNPTITIVINLCRVLDINLNELINDSSKN